MSEQKNPLSSLWWNREKKNVILSFFENVRFFFFDFVQKVFCVRDGFVASEFQFGTN